MEHPILFISVILEALGLPVPHTPTGHGLLEQLCTPYMTYTWLVMAFWIIVPKLTMGRLEIIPDKGQNFWEVLIGGLENFVAFMLIIELISNFARLLSLSMRLFGNIMAKETLLSVLFMLAGAYFAPLPILVLGVLVSLIQALVFTLLSVLYCAQAMEHAH
jgi:F0F1-type ATP synthase membrane subunit a